MSQRRKVTTPLYHRNAAELKDVVWPTVEAGLHRMKTIITEHFKVSCGDLEFLDEGAYARVYKGTLASGLELAVRMVLPVRKGVKTEAEVATMDAIRARTSIPVPKVYLFCSTLNNPMGVEWIVMQHMPGEPFIDCFDTLPVEAKRATARDIADIMHCLFSITATHCGSLLADHSLTDDQCARRYGEKPQLSPTVDSQSHNGFFTLGPSNDFAFMESLSAITINERFSGPFKAERHFLEALAFAGIPEKKTPQTRLLRWPYEKVLEVYDKLRALYDDPVDDEEQELQVPFHFSHGDLSVSNILLDPSTGRVTGVIDWEVAGFRPSWLAASAGAWFNDDDNHFFMGPFQDELTRAQDESTEETDLREYFRAQVGKRGSELLHHMRYGAELRSLYSMLSYHIPSVVMVWLHRYEEQVWDVDSHGPFPFDIIAWLEEHYTLWKQLYDAGEDV